MQQVQQVVQIDTIYHKVQVIDTVYTKIFVNDTIQPDLVQVYQGLINSQDNKFDNILVMVGIAAALLIVLFGVINFSATRILFKIDAKRLFNKRKKKLINELNQLRKESIERNKVFLNASQANTLAVHSDSPDKQYTALYISIGTAYKAKHIEDENIMKFMVEIALACANTITAYSMQYNCCNVNFYTEIDTILEHLHQDNKISEKANELIELIARIKLINN